MPGPYNLTITGSLTFSAGKYGNAASGFSTSNYLATTSGPLAAGVLPAFSISQLIKTTSTAQRVSAKIGNNVYLGISSGFYAIVAPGFGWVQSSILVNDGLWHEVAATYDGSGNFFLWVDGVRDLNLFSSVTTTTSHFSIGEDGDSPGGPFPGAIDETKVYDRVEWTGTSYTPPTTAYAGGNVHVIAYYALDSDGSDTAAAGGATSYTMTGPSSGTVLVASTNFTLTPNAAYTGTITPNDNSGGGTFTPTSLTWTGDASAKTFTYTPATTGAKTIRATSSPALTDPANLTYTANAASATSYTLSGPSGGLVGAASTNFTVMPNGLFTGTITPTPVAGCTFTPSSLAYSAESTAKTFTVTPSTSGVKTIATTNSGSLTNPSSVSYTASNTALFAFDVPSDNSLGAAVSGTTTWGNRALVCNGGYTWFNRLVTGTDCVIPSYLSSAANGLQITVSNPDGTSPVTTTPTLVTGSWQHNANIPVFTGLGSDTAKLVVIRALGLGAQSLDGDEFLKVQAGGTPACTLPAGHGEVIRMNALPSYVAREGVGADGGTLQSASGYQMVNATMGGVQIASLKHRLRAGITDVWIAVYGTGAMYHLNSVAGDGSSGVPLDAGQTITDAGTGKIENWLHLATGINSSIKIHEITQALPAGILIAAIMVGGGTGIDHTATSLKRTLKIVGVGDSRVNALDGTTGSGALGRVDLGVMEILSQTYNCQVINLGLRGTLVSGWNSGNILNALDSLPSLPQIAYTDIGVNDAINGHSVATLNADKTTFLTTMRAKLPGVPILEEAMKPCTSFTFAAMHLYNVGILGVASSLRTGGDSLLFYVDTEAWNLAGIPFKTGGSFDTTLFYDFVHENPAGQIVDANLLKAAMDAQLTTATSYTLTGPSTGVVSVASTNFTVTPNAPFTGTITPTPVAGCTFTPSSLTWTGDASAKTFTVTPTTTGAKTIATTNGGGLTNPSSLTYTVSAAPATAYTLGLSASSGIIGAPVTLTLTGNGPTTATVTLPSPGVAGTYSNSTPALNGTTPVTVTWKPSAAGLATFSPINTAGLTNPADQSYTATSTPPTLVIVTLGVGGIA